MSLFLAHCLPVASAARDLDSVFVDVATLVALSIRQPWEAMPRQFADVKARGAESVWLFGHKRAGFEYVRQNARMLRNAAILAHESGDLDGLILKYLGIPGLGLVKASFLAQMTVGDGACLDSHNLTRLGFSEEAFKTPKSLKVGTLQTRIHSYNAVWRAHGDSAFWWNSWCEYLAGRSRNSFVSAEEVSEVHTLPLYY